MGCVVCGSEGMHAKGLCNTCYANAYYKANRDRILSSCKELSYAHGAKPASENKQCSAFLGVHVAERVLSKVFKDVKAMPPNHPGYDFICSKGKKIDVKSACIYTRPKWSGSWNFVINKNKVADFFLCLAFDNRKDLNPLHIWLIPGVIINTLVGAGISESTLPKWDEYKLDINKVITCCDSMKQKPRH